MQRARGDCGNLERTHPPEEGLVLPPGTNCCYLSLSFSKANQTFKHLCEISDLLAAGNKFKHFKDDYGYRKYVQLDFMSPVKYLCLIRSRVLNGQAAAWEPMPSKCETLKDENFDHFFQGHQVLICLDGSYTHQN